MGKKAADKRAPETRREPVERPVPPPVAKPSRLPAFLEKRAGVVSLALVLLATVRIVSTYTVFSHTFDEPVHIACGMEWLSKGKYTLETQHPPLSRVMAALGPYLLGTRSQNTPASEMNTNLVEGDAILNYGHHYDLSLALSRLGILPFFWVACFVVYVWGRRYFSGAIAVLAVFLFSFIPPVLAHAGLSTTDMALTAFLAATFLAGYIWLEQPTTKHALWFGVCAGLMMLSKFSCLVYLPASAGLALLWYVATDRPGIAKLIRGIRERALSFGLAVLVACLLIWTGYRFSFGAVSFTSLRLPAPELYDGIQYVMRHNANGHPGYLLGERSRNGWWYFYEVAMAVKTPLGFLGLLFAGIAMAFRDRRRNRQLWPALLFSAGILVVGAFSHINIGIRHVLPIYVGFALIAAVALARAIENVNAKTWVPVAAGLLTLWMAVSSLISHPDYLPYFNELAGSQPENILVDSDLDWGQDIKRLSAKLKQVHAKEVAFITLIVADLEKEQGFPHVNGVHPAIPDSGWNAVEKTYWKEFRLGLFEGHPEVTPWPDLVPRQQQVGKSILLYYFPYPGEQQQVPH